MTLIKCKECHEEISDKATTCIHCGCPVEKEEMVCAECGNKLNAKDKVCSNCGCPIDDKESKNSIDNIKNKANYILMTRKSEDNKIRLIVGGIIGACILLLIIHRISTPNIVGTWEYSNILYYSETGIVETYEFKKNGKATLQREVYSALLDKDAEATFNCTYKFRRNNTQIKISCDYDTEEARERNNKWVNFKHDGDVIYIDNQKYKHI